MAYAEEAGLAVSVAVVDAHGCDVAFERGDGATWFTPEVARTKARTAVAFGATSESLATMRGQYPELFALVGEQLVHRPTTLPGGVPLLEGGEVLGGIGVSGARPDDDVRAAEAGARAASHDRTGERADVRDDSLSRHVPAAETDARAPSRRPAP